MSELQNDWRPLPLTLEAITPQWLSAALSVRHPGTRVKSVEVSNRRSGTSTSSRMVLEYEGETGLPRTLYIKGGFQEAMRRRVWAALAIEAQFYDRIAPTLPIRMPRSYFAGVDESTRQGIVIFEDLTLRGVGFGHATQPLGADAIAKVLDLQARMHAQWWERPALAELAQWAQPQRVFLKYLLRQKHWNEVLQRPYADRIPAPLRDADFVAHAHDRLWALNDSRRQTLVHGDCHGGNLFFERDGSPGLLDWQCTARGHWAHDVMWIIVSAMDIEARRAHERDLLEHYLGQLSACGAPAPRFDEAWLAYRQNMMHGMSSSVANPYDMQSETVTRLSAERVLAAIEDLDVLESLGLT